jgi:hypothetical protein
VPAPFPQAKQGKPVNNHPSGFPAFFRKRQPRVVTADPWAFLKELVTYRLEEGQHSRGYSYVNQASDFFEAAANPRFGSRPLLYYYSFLNLAKAALLINRARLAIKPDHGISDPRTNQRRRMRLGGQKVTIEGRAVDHSRLFAEFIRILGGNTKRRVIPVVALLAQIPSIHRTFMQVTKRPPLFTPIKRIDVLRSGGEVWARTILEREDKDVGMTFPTLKRRRAFRRRLQQKLAQSDNEIWLETVSVPGQRRGVDGAIQTLARHLLEVGVSTVLTASGYRFYFSGAEPRFGVPRLAATYAAFFYLSSITRYRPDAFDSILEGGYSWLVNELIATEPIQFVYTLASELAGVDVVRPYATGQ